jgi:hypothetical protein
MTPRTATARQHVERSFETPQSAPRLRVARPSAASASSRPRKGRLLLRPVAVATGFVVASLLAVVIGNMVLASGQLQLEQLQTRVATTESNTALKLELSTEKQSPAIAAIDAQTHGLVQAQVFPIPAASLTRRLAPPTLSLAPCCALTPR